MPRPNLMKSVCVLALLCALTAIASSAQTYTTMHVFVGTDGQGPNGPLALGADGKLYGTTAVGGANGNGTVFNIAPGGNLTSFQSVCTGRACPTNPLGGLVASTSGTDFYGTTMYGGANGDYGSVFKITSTGKLVSIYNFCSQSNCTDGTTPFAGLTPDSAGNFFGTTGYGGFNCVSGACAGGTVFRITAIGKLTTLYSFCSKSNCTDGEIPQAALVEGSDGNFYGTTWLGGTTGNGTIFKITPAGQLTTLYSFCSQSNCTDGSQPSGPLVQAVDGNFYGVTFYGGANGGAGTVFKITAHGQLSTIYSFCPNCGRPSYPVAALVQGTDGNFYGTTLGGIFSCGTSYVFGCGTAFEITPSGLVTVLHNFDGTDGISPTGLVQSTDGNFYGTAQFGDTNVWYGSIFRISTGLGQFVTFVRNAGKVGQTGGILGQGLTGASSVSFNGVPTNFTVVSDSFLRATVPSGATTGYVTVTTPGGTLTSNVPFQVIQ